MYVNSTVPEPWINFQVTRNAQPFGIVGDSACLPRAKHDTCVLVYRSLVSGNTTWQKSSLDGGVTWSDQEAINLDP